MIRRISGTVLAAVTTAVMTAPVVAPALTGHAAEVTPIAAGNARSVELGIGALVDPVNGGGEWNGTPFDEYLLLDVFAGRGNNEAPFSFFYQHDYENDVSEEDGGVRLLHVDTRLMRRTYYSAESLGWFDDFSKAQRNKAQFGGYREKLPDNVANTAPHEFDGRAQITPEQIAHVYKILLNNRLIQPVVRPLLFLHGYRDFFVHERIAGQQLGQEERDRSQHEHGEQRDHDTLQNISQHRKPFIDCLYGFLGRTSGGNRRTVSPGKDDLYSATCTNAKSAPKPESTLVMV